MHFPISLPLILYFLFLNINLTLFAFINYFLETELFDSSSRLYPVVRFFPELLSVRASSIVRTTSNRIESNLYAFQFGDLLKYLTESRRVYHLKHLLLLNMRSTQNLNYNLNPNIIKRIALIHLCLFLLIIYICYPDLF